MKLFPFVFTMLVVWLLTLWAVLTLGCAAPDPDPPIRAYRAAYGFTP